MTPFRTFMETGNLTVENFLVVFEVDHLPDKEVWGKMSDTQVRATQFVIREAHLFIPSY